MIWFSVVALLSVVHTPTAVAHIQTSAHRRLEEIVVLPSVATFVNSGSPKRGFGSSNKIKVVKKNSRKEKHSLLRFDLPPTNNIEKVELVVKCIDGSSKGGEVYKIDSVINDDVTWNNRPYSDGQSLTKLASFGSVSQGSRHALDISSLIVDGNPLDSEINLVIFPENNDEAAYDKNDDGIKLVLMASDATAEPSDTPSWVLSSEPSLFPTWSSTSPTSEPSFQPSLDPSQSPAPTVLSPQPSSGPSFSGAPSEMPSFLPSAVPTVISSEVPSAGPSELPSEMPTAFPSFEPTQTPTTTPTLEPLSAKPTPHPVTDKELQIMLYWDKDSDWQDLKDRRRWCVNADSRKSGKLINIEKCDDNSKGQRWIRDGETIRSADTNLCWDYDDRLEYKLQKCGSSRYQKIEAAPYFKTSGTKKEDRFKLHPGGDDDDCVTQHHHPRDGEILRTNPCWLAKKQRTMYWVAVSPPKIDGHRK